MTASNPTTESTTVSGRRILVVCVGNHCRSPLAAEVLARRGGAAVDIRSAGTRDRWAGRPAHPLMIEAAARLGYDLSGHRGTFLSAGLMDWADRVLAMDRLVLAALQTLADDRVAPKLGLYLGDRNVPDPWGLPLPAFEDCAALIEEGAYRHLLRP